MGVEKATTHKTMTGHLFYWKRDDGVVL